MLLFGPRPRGASIRPAPPLTSSPTDGAPCQVGNRARELSPTWPGRLPEHGELLSHLLRSSSGWWHWAV